MSVAKRMQLEPGQAVLVLRRPAEVDLDIDPGDLVDDRASADAALVFVTSTEDLATSDAETVSAEVSPRRLMRRPGSRSA